MDSFLASIHSSLHCGQSVCPPLTCSWSSDWPWHIWCSHVFAQWAGPSHSPVIPHETYSGQCGFSSLSPNEGRGAEPPTQSFEHEKNTYNLCVTELVYSLSRSSSMGLANYYRQYAANSQPNSQPSNGRMAVLRGVTPLSFHF